MSATQKDDKKSLENIGSCDNSICNNTNSVLESNVHRLMPSNNWRRNFNEINSVLVSERTVERFSYNSLQHRGKFDPCVFERKHRDVQLNLDILLVFVVGAPDSLLRGSHPSRNLPPVHPAGLCVGPSDWRNVSGARFACPPRNLSHHGSKCRLGRLVAHDLLPGRDYAGDDAERASGPANSFHAVGSYSYSGDIFAVAVRRDP